LAEAFFLFANNPLAEANGNEILYVFYSPLSVGEGLG
jgi:hypothetical protein